MVTTLDDIIASGDLEGFKPGQPPPGPFGGEDIDAEVCANASCPECHYKGMEFHPFIRYRTYRAFAVCPACHHAMEF